VSRDLIKKPQKKRVILESRSRGDSKKGCTKTSMVPYLETRGDQGGGENRWKYGVGEERAPVQDTRTNQEGAGSPMRGGGAWEKCHKPSVL